MARGVVCAVMLALLLALPVHELEAARQPTRWGQGIKNFFDLGNGSSLDLLKKLSVGTAIIAVLGCSALYCNNIADNFMRDNSATQSNIMLDTIIRFDDDILGNMFHYTIAGYHYQGEAVEWNSPYDKIQLYSLQHNDYALIPVQNLLGKEIMFHDHTYAWVTFIDPDNNNFLLQGKVWRVFDNDYYRVLAEKKENRYGVVSKLDEPSFVFVSKKLLTSIEPSPTY